MKIFAISDLHLSFQTDKPMNLFGEHWDGYEQKIMDDWNSKVGPDDIGIIAGDISWAMKMEETVKDFEYIKKLNGKKIIIRGNHDYWWKSISKIREALAPDGYALQNDAIQIGDITFAGTRGWRVPERKHVQSGEDKKIYSREIIRFELSLKDARQKMGLPPLGKQEDPITEEVTLGEGSFVESLARKENEQNGKRLVAIIHYPPFNATLDSSPFTRLCEKYGVTACIYGHLHGKQGRTQHVVEKNGVKYYLTSCDKLNHKVATIPLD